MFAFAMLLQIGGNTVPPDSKDAPETLLKIGRCSLHTDYFLPLHFHL